MSYSKAEVGAIAGVSVATTKGWVSRGRTSGGGKVRLRTLRAPRGKVSPGALCSFLAAVNGIPVRVREKI
jgi:transposase